MPTEISTIEQLQAMRVDSRGEFILTNDIDASSTAGWNGGLGWESFSLQGELNGNGFRITGLYSRFTGHRSSALFSETLAGSRIHNLMLVDPDLVATGSSQYGGVFSADHYGTIEQCAAVGGIVSRDSWYIGAFAGRNRATGIVRDCLSLDTVCEGFGSDSRIGSVAGRQEIGGIVQRCVSTGAVNRWGGTPGGAMVGSNAGTVQTSFYDSERIGIDSTPVGTPKTTAELRSLSTYTAAGWDIVAGLSDSHVWGIDPTINDGYPFLQVFHTGPGRKRKRRRLLAAHHHFAIRRR